MAEKRIAIIDSMFWDNHEDISFAVIRDLDVNNDTSINATDYAHGTHVTGIALAKHDNSLGISGVFPKGKAVAIGTAGVNRANPGDNNQPMYWIEYKESILVALINDAHVINQSMGFGFDDDTTPNDDGEMLTAEEKRTNHINNRNELVSYYNGFFGNFFSALEQMTEIEKAAGNTRSYDFIFVNSAGNDEIDAQHNWWSQYITDPAFTERLLTVGSVGQNEQGELVYSSFSNWGTAVNIAAPGENILSTVPADYKLYQTLGGTSMAAPHVAGVAAMVWSISPKELTGPEVVDIILENSVLPITDSRNYSYPFLDAYSSTKDAFEKSQAKGLVFGTVTDSKTFNHLNAEVSFIPESICNADSIIHIPQIGASGTYEIELPIGFYELQVSKAGYITHQEHILVTSDKNIQISTALVPNMNIPEVTKGTINGSITLNSLAVSGIEIDILDGTTHVATTITNEAGQFIVDLDPGTYVLSIDVEGYVPVSKNTTVFVGKTTTENIELDDSMYATVEMRRIDYLNHYIINIHNAKKSVEQIDFKLTLVNGTILYDTAQGIINDSWRIEDEIVFILDDELIQGSELVVTSTDGNGRHYEGSIILGAAWRDGQSATLIAR